MKISEIQKYILFSIIKMMKNIITVTQIYE